ncbi:unnamed protein product [Musa hybrid cultivar]
MAPAVVAPTATPAPFHPDRVRVLKPGSPSPSGPVVYWMFRDQRSNNNWALIHAAALAARSDAPLAVAFCLSHRFLGAHARQLGFMLRGLRHLRGRLAALGLPFFLLRGDAPDALPGFLSRLGASALVADFSPLRPVRAWKDALCERLPAAVAVHEVDAHNVVPVWVASDKLEYGAKTIRPKIHRLLTEYLVEFPQLPPPAVPWTGEAPPEIDWDELIDEALREAGEVPEIGWCEPGEEAAMEALMGRKDGFLTKRLKHYDSDRNDPVKSRALSGLSPYLHFGQISAQRCALEAWKFRKSYHQSVDAFLEELIVRRELADNFCYYQPHYDSLQGAWEWARKTLMDHAADKREHIYTKEQLEKAETADPLWNASQLEMVYHGKMHGFMRMYWAKKILEWTNGPEEALSIAIYLNDKYELDGRDPSGYVGCMWSICGVHDQHKSPSKNNSSLESTAAVTTETIVSFCNILTTANINAANSGNSEDLQREKTMKKKKKIHESNVKRQDIDVVHMHAQHGQLLPIPQEQNTIVEHQKEEQQEEAAGVRFSAYVHKPTPLHPSIVGSSTVTTPPALTTRRPSRTRGQDDGEAVYVSCDKCRPTSRDKLISVVPLDNAAGHKHSPAGSSSPGPGGLLRSLFLSVTRRSPTAAAGVPSTASAASAVREDQWRLVAAELSRKLLHATRKRDEALLEASRLEYSLTELERKIDRLESHCRDLRASIQPGPALGPSTAPFPTEAFHVAIADARAAVRQLARSLIAHVRLGPPGSRSSDRLTALIQHDDPWASVQWRRNPGGLLFHMEALLSQAFYAGFEEDDEEEARLIDPAARCEASRAGYEAVRGLGWDEVLCKGTRHYSEGLSRFCDRKMSEVVGVVGWDRAWPEGLLQAFFEAAKGAWVVRLMARSVQPALPVLRADQGARFDCRFMEDVAADRVRRLTPANVRMMVAPGFHVYNAGGGGVVKCTVLCAYNSSNSD